MKKIAILISMFLLFMTRFVIAADYCEELKTQDIEGKNVSILLAGGASAQGVVSELHPGTLVLNTEGALHYLNCDNIIQVTKASLPASVMQVADTAQVR